jgi:hypothetical protein
MTCQGAAADAPLSWLAAAPAGGMRKGSHVAAHVVSVVSLDGTVRFGIGLGGIGLART